MSISALAPAPARRYHRGMSQPRAIHCRPCGALLAPTDELCPVCGTPTHVGAFRLDWVWIIYGTVIISTLQGLVLAIAGMSFLGEELAAALTSQDEASFGAVSVKAALLTAGGYLTGGVMIGRMSDGHTMIEPAIAAGVPAAVLLGYVLVRLHAELAATGVFWYVALAAAGAVLVCFLVALAGGYLGERWQDLVIARRRRAANIQ